MSHGPEHHIEHAEHAAHAARDPFDKRVTMTIAIVAALLACVTLLSHRAHNLTTSLQIESNDALTESANKWNYFQSKKNRQYLYETAAAQARMDLERPSSAGTNDDAWRKSVKDREGKWLKDVERYRGETKEIEEKANRLTQEADALRKESEHVHHIGNRYDIAELGVEMGLVLCSLAVLTKKRGFWFVGMGFAAVGVVLMALAAREQYLSGHETKDHDHAKASRLLPVEPQRHREARTDETGVRRLCRSPVPLWPVGLMGQLSRIESDEEFPDRMATSVC